MVRFGIIGTNFITDLMIESSKHSSEFILTAIYSRNYETGKKFGEKYNVGNIFTDIDEMIKSGTIDAVYIASPNSFHCKQTIKFLENKIAVLCEKPLATNKTEVLKMIEAANKNKTLLMEGMRLVYNPNFQVLKDTISEITPIRSAVLQFCQYSSRYDKYKEGIILNAFKKELGNGSIMDIGIYPVYLMIGLFGTPLKQESSAFFLKTGVDSHGTLLLKYDGFNSIVNHSKISNCYISSEIIGEKGSIIIDKVSTLNKITLKLKDGMEKDITVERLEEDMFYEIEEFIKCFKRKSIESEKNPHSNSIKAIEVLDEYRKNIGLKFENE